MGGYSVLRLVLSDNFHLGGYSVLGLGLSENFSLGGGGGGILQNRGKLYNLDQNFNHSSRLMHHR